MEYITRDEWGARSPKSSYSKITDIKGIAIHWNGPKLGIGSHSQCAGKIRGIQNYHMDANGWNDIAYSWFVCPHGFIYEGRGWGNRTAAQGTNFGNGHYHAVYYLGGEGDTFTEEAKTGIRVVVDESKRRYQDDVRPHSYFKSTGCPGNTIRNWIDAGLPVVEPEPEVTDETEWENFWMSLTDAEKNVLKQLAGELAGPNGVTNGASFARQFLIFHREERPKLTLFFDEIDRLNSSVIGQVRAAVAVWREAGARGWKRDVEAVKENRAYTAEELEIKCPCCGK